MIKLLFSLLFLALFLFPNPVKADIFIDQVPGTGDFSQYRFAVNASNADNVQGKITNTSDITFDITAWDNSGEAAAFKDENHYIRLEKPGYSCIIDIDLFPVKTFPYGFTAFAKPQSSSQVVMKFTPQKSLASNNWACNLESGTYKLSMWSKRSKTFIFQNVDFPVDSNAGGNDPALQYVPGDQNLICKDKKPVAKVIASNLTAGKTYRLWWDGHQRNWAWKGTADATSKTIELDIGDTPLVNVTSDTSFRKDAANFLCLAEGDASFPAVAYQGQCNSAAGNAYLPFYYPEDQNICNKALEQKCEARITQAANNTGKKKSQYFRIKFKTPGFGIGSRPGKPGR